jgi:hypothetical protein
MHLKFEEIAKRKKRTSVGYFLLHQASESEKTHLMSEREKE